jgi:hypothetical protein
MTKLSKDEFISKISDKVTDENVALELLEDISDSFDSSEVETLRDELKKKEAENAELKQRYKERFLSGVVKEEKIDEPVEKEYVDIRAI